MVTPMSKTPNLPEEIITNILIRLPAKSIGQFRCVSKPWLSMLTNKNFIETHLKLHKEEEEEEDEEKLLLISASHSLHTIITFTSQNNAVSRKLNFPPHLENNWFEVVGSCNGLVLAVNGDGYDQLKFLINPTTLEHIQVPNSPLALPQPGSFCMYGLGYDESADDYKVVALSYYDTDNEYEPDVDYTFVDVYSLRTNSWRRLESSPYDHAVPDIASGVFVNGAIHWLASSKSSGYPSVIAAFDLASEKFSEVPAPNELDKGMFVFNKLVVLEGCLCMVVEQRRIGIDVWMMKDYGVEESWMKMITVNETDYCDILKPLYLVGDHEAVVLEVDGEKLILYDLKEERSTDMVVDGAPAMFGNGWTFEESLVSPQLFVSRNISG